jgi:twinkle protein
MEMLSELHQKFLQKRFLDVASALHMGIYSGKREPDGTVKLDEEGDVLVFPTIKNGVEVAAKYRGPYKSFWCKTGGSRHFYNCDVLGDPALIDGSASLLIVEGELDALAALSAGYPFVVSVPLGAPPPHNPDGSLIVVPEGVDDIDPENDAGFDYIRNDWEQLSQIKSIIIAADNDPAGRRLTQELVRRLDKIRCKVVEFPEGCKDINDVLVNKGIVAVHDLIKGAKHLPIASLLKEADIPSVDGLKTYSTGWHTLDEILRVYLGAFMVVGGFPGHGKSTWVTQLAAQLARSQSWNVAIASFEMQIKPYVTNALMSAFLGINIKNAPPQSFDKARAFLNERFLFVVPDYKNVEIEHDIDWLIDKLTAAVIRDKVKMVVIDPFNEIEHRRNKDESQTEYIGRAIKKLKAFALTYTVLVVVVVHPTKASQHLDSEELSLYSLADSSHWANKADIGVIVGRIGDPQHDVLTGIYVKKIRYQPDAGILGSQTLTFDKEKRLFLL